MHVCERGENGVCAMIYGAERIPDLKHLSAGYLDVILKYSLSLQHDVAVGNSTLIRGGPKTNCCNRDRCL